MMKAKKIQVMDGEKIIEIFNNVEYEWLTENKIKIIVSTEDKRIWYLGTILSVLIFQK